MLLYKNTKAIVRSPDSDTDFINIVTGILQGDTLTLCMFITCLDGVQRASPPPPKKRPEADDIPQKLG